MSDTATCDRCNGSINRGEGFVVYSKASFGPPNALQETGNMLLCGSCVDDILNANNFATEFPQQQELSADILTDMARLRPIMQQANTASIVGLCKKRGLGPHEAKAKAREFARSWWQDARKAQLDAASYWTSAEETAGSSSEDYERMRAATATAMDAVFGPMSGPKPTTPESQKKTGCFVATACYGSEHCSEVLTLRAFRDRHLLHSQVGRACVSLYYTFSPPLARAVRHHDCLRRVVRCLAVQPVVRVVSLFSKQSNQPSDRTR